MSTIQPQTSTQDAAITPPITVSVVGRQFGQQAAQAAVASSAVNSTTNSTTNSTINSRHGKRFSGSALSRISEVSNETAFNLAPFTTPSTVVEQKSFMHNAKQRMQTTFHVVRRRARQALASQFATAGIVFVVVFVLHYA